MTLHAIRTRNTERAVEVPEAMRFLDGVVEPVLEVGNVLSRFGCHTPRMVVDKYEQANGVLNQDVLEINPEYRFSRIVSVSTMEHVGWDEPEKLDEVKAIQAIAFLKSLLVAGGRLLVTTPIGWHPTLDDWMFSQHEASYMRRDCGKWVMCDASEARRARFGFPHPYANAVAFYRFMK